MVRPRAFRQQSAQVIQVAVAVAPHPTAPQNRPLNQAVVAEPVEQDERAPIDQRRQQRNIGLIAGIEHQRPLGLLEPSQGLLHLGKARLRATDQTRGRGTGPVVLDKLNGPRLHKRMRCQAEVVVGAKIDQLAAMGANSRTAARLVGPQRPHLPGLLPPRQFSVNKIEFRLHKNEAVPNGPPRQGKPPTGLPHKVRRSILSLGNLPLRCHGDNDQ